MTWRVVVDEYEDGGVPLADKWIEDDAGDILLRAASNSPMDDDRARREVAALDCVAAALNSGTPPASP